MIMGEDGEAILYDRCNFSDFEGKNITIQILRSNFTNYVDENDGGAIRIVKCGIKCNNTAFIDCESINGGGGGIYIKNHCLTEQNITLIDLFFLRCTANYGGAAYIYCSNEESHVLIQSCKFLYNEATRKSDPLNKNMFGGAAVFLSSKNLFINDTTFDHSKGKSAVKVFNVFDDIKTERKLNQLEETSSNNVISIVGCNFDNKDESSNAINFISDETRNEIELNNCNFKGKLAKGYHYIDGNINDNKSPMININSCNFEYEIDTSVNKELIKEISLVKIIKPLNHNDLSNNFHISSWKTI